MAHARAPKPAHAAHTAPSATAPAAHVADPAATAAAPHVAAAPASDAVTVVLHEPIARAGGAAISSLTLRKPRAGELRGLKLQDLMQSDINTIIAVLPRISQPFITDAEAANLSSEDVAEIGGAILGFFMSREMKAAIAAMAGQ